MDSFMQMAMGINMNDELKDFRKFESHPAVKVCFNPFLPDSHKSIQGSDYNTSQIGAYNTSKVGAYNTHHSRRLKK